MNLSPRYLPVRHLVRWLAALIAASTSLTVNTLTAAPVHAAPAGVVEHPRDTVLLLHGLGRGALAMKRVERSLRDDGYLVISRSYPSQRHDIATLAEATLGPVFTDPAASTSTTAPGARAGRVHIVTHSLGGILVRQYLATHGVPAQLGRVVMLAPPNHGSEIVDRLRGWRVYRWFNGPAGVQLGTDAESVPNVLGPLPPGAEVGVIAGDRTLNPLTSAWIAGIDDGKVSVASTRLDGMAAHRVVHSSHTWLMWRTGTLVEIRAFLRTGAFTAR